MSLQYTQKILIEKGTFTEQDLEQINRCRGDHNRLGFGYQIIFVKARNYFPKQQPFQIIDEILNLSSMQLNISEATISEYVTHREHISTHQKKIKSYLGLQIFGNEASEKACNFLYHLCFQLTQNNVLLLKVSQYLQDEKILKPSDDTLNRLISTQKEKARDDILKKITSLLTDDMKASLEDIISVSETERFSKLQQLKRPPGNPSPDSMKSLVRKLNYIKETQILSLNLDWLNNNYKRMLTKYCKRCSAHRLRKMEERHRYATIICFLNQTYKDTVDFMVDMQSKLMNKVYNHAKNEMGRQMQKKRKVIRTTIRSFKSLSQIILNDDIEDEKLRTALFKMLPKDVMQAQSDDVEEWLSGKYSHEFKLVVNRFSYLRQFSPDFLEHIHIQQENTGSTSLIEAIRTLKELNSTNKRKLPDDVTTGFVPKSLASFVNKEDGIDKQGWECALLTRISDEIKNGNLSIENSKRFGRFSQFFVPDSHWSKNRSSFFKASGIPENPKDVYTAPS